MSKLTQQIEHDAHKRGLTMTEVCRRAGIDYSTWWRWKSSKSDPRTSKVERMREAIKRKMKND